MRAPVAAKRLNRSEWNWMRHRRSGKTFAGYHIWTAEEDRTLRRMMPDYAAIKAALKRRTLISVKGRASRLGLLQSHRSWLAADLSRLRRAYPTVGRDELLASFPGRSLAQIAAKAFKLGLRRPRRPPVKSGILLIDAIRNRAAALKLSTRDIDELARTKTYFLRSSWFGQKSGSAVAIARAVEALGGRLVIEWRD